ncbi:MAG: beta-phosphoglucomutase [Cyanobacteria bacterium P01_A01_bin.45]
MLQFEINNSAPTSTSVETVNKNVIETEFDPRQLHHKETVFSLSNGYIGVRGSFEEGYPENNPGTMINGVYDDVEVALTELVNCPNWLPLLTIIDGEPFSMDAGEIISYERRLDLSLGLLSRDIRWKSPKGHTLDFHFQRFVSLADQHTLAIRLAIASVDFDGEIKVLSGFDAQSETKGKEHWKTIAQGTQTNQLWLHSQTLSSKIELGMAAKILVRVDTQDIDITSQISSNDNRLELTHQITPGQTLKVEKIVAVYTSRETKTPLEAALNKLEEKSTYQTNLATHIASWEKLWQDNDIIIEGDDKAQLGVRYNLFQILSVAPRHDDRVSIPPKTLTGFAYHGHIFWDTEIFILPLLTYTQPALARNLLNYRYHTLPGARRKAQEAGHKGAIFAWESATTGDEVTPKEVFDPNGEVVRIWCGDLEIHINADIAYGIWNYWQATKDDQWMRDYGASIFLETAAFWESRTEWNLHHNYYEIRDVIGPDEHHERINNNAFTNIMAAWHLNSAVEVWNWLEETYPEAAKQLSQKLNLNSENFSHWTKISQNMYVSTNKETGLIEQFDGYFSLKDINPDDYADRTKSIQSVLGVEETNQSQIIKQPDVLMLFYMLRDRYDLKTIQANWDYYTPRTDHTHGSSLGPAINAIIACELQQPQIAYHHFMRAALVDLENSRLNANDGIHGASAGGIWQAIVFGFAGVRFTPSGAVASPVLPPHWTRLQFRLQYQGEWYDFDLRNDNNQDGIRVKSQIKGAIFDLDGVITDSSEYHYQAWQKLADQEGIPFNREANEAIRGVPRRESLLTILGDRTATEAEIQEMMTRKNNYYIELIQNVSPKDLLPGVAELLNQMRASGVKLALGSSSKNARTVIKLLQIDDLFDAIADGYSVEKHKPEPDLFLFAAEGLGLSPSECIVLEDAEAGVEAGLAAGMKVVGLGPTQRVGKANVVLSDFDGVTWEQLRSQLQD